MHTAIAVESGVLRLSLSDFNRSHHGSCLNTDIRRVPVLYVFGVVFADDAEYRYAGDGYV